jgi:hypothetical protein
VHALARQGCGTADQVAISNDGESRYQNAIPSARIQLRHLVYS